MLLNCPLRVYQVVERLVNVKITPDFTFKYQMVLSTLRLINVDSTVWHLNFHP